MPRLLTSVVALVGLATTAASSPAGCTVENINAAFSADNKAEAISAVYVPNNGTYGQEGDIAYPLYAYNLPALCAVMVNATSSATTSYTFGLLLPDEWNNRTLTVGNGGFVGGINWAEMGNGVKYGFTAISTNTGHNSTGINMEWAVGNEESKTDWAY